MSEQSAAKIERLKPWIAALSLVAIGVLLLVLDGKEERWRVGGRNGAPVVYFGYLFVLGALHFLLFQLCKFFTPRRPVLVTSLWLLALGGALVGGAQVYPGRHDLGIVFVDMVYLGAFLLLTGGIAAGFAFFEHRQLSRSASHEAAR